MDTKDEIKEGTACRIKGKVPVLKGNGDRLVISPGKIISLGNFVTHMDNGDNRKLYILFQKYFSWKCFSSN